MKGVKRLTPIVPGEQQPVLWVDGTIKCGFVGGGPTDGRGFPQWAQEIFNFGKVHWHLDPADGVSKTLCGREEDVRRLYLPGNFPRCKRCESALSKQQKYLAPKDAP